MLGPTYFQSYKSNIPSQYLQKLIIALQLHSIPTNSKYIKLKIHSASKCVLKYFVAISNSVPLNIAYHDFSPKLVDMAEQRALKLETANGLFNWYDESNPDLKSDGATFTSATVTKGIWILYKHVNYAYTNWPIMFVQT